MILFRFAIPAHVYGTRRHFEPAILSVLIVFFLSSLAVQAVPEAAHKTDAELTKALIGRWELPGKVEFPKHFLTYNADGPSEGFWISDNRGSPGRVQTEARWRVKDGYLEREIIKELPANYEPLPYKVHLQIE